MTLTALGGIGAGFTPTYFAMKGAEEIDVPDLEGDTTTEETTNEEINEDADCCFDLEVDEDLGELEEYDCLLTGDCEEDLTANEETNTNNTNDNEQDNATTTDETNNEIFS